MEKQTNFKFLVILCLIFLLVAGYINSLLTVSYPPGPLIPPGPAGPPSQVEFEDFKKFSSEKEFKDYLARSEMVYGDEFGQVGLGGIVSMFREVAFQMSPKIMEEGVGGVGAGEVPERVSETTVQVAGIDEPDIVKTDGEQIYFSPGQPRELFSRSAEMVVPPEKMPGETKIIKAFPPAGLALEGEIDDIRGDLLLQENILVIFAGNKIYGYDVSDPKNPQKKWASDLKSNSYIVSARLYQGKIYLVTRTSVNTYRPCPIEPLSVNGESLEIKCVDIYHPTTPIPVDVTYTALVLNPSSGQIEKTISFVGTAGSSVLYMSPDALFITYSYFGDFVKFYLNFFKEKCQDIIAATVIEKLEKLVSYDISNSAKLTEFQVIMENFYNSLTEDERLRLENELTNRMTDYYQEHKRELEKTGIVKIDLDNFAVAATADIPGQPLNQFSLDEYQDHLRVAVTVGQRWGIFWGMSQTSNDVYVLDKDLKITGQVKDMGVEERIYSVRFLEDKGYVVTFKQIDPFFVLDLADPQNPALRGELKIPGYSSYLHPITKDKILGVGKESAKVKISLFDVVDPSNPAEIAKYTLDEYWSDILNTHHAFLLDKKHQIFFLPGSKGGYIFSYQNNELKLTRAVSGISARRAIYINDYLYIIGDDKIAVLDEINWQEVNALSF